MTHNVPLAGILTEGFAEMGLLVSGDQLASCLLLAAELKKWNRRVNLTAITDDRGIAAKHLIDSCMLASTLPERGQLLDIGSGAGFPAIPIALFRPDMSVVSIDAVAKKISFQRHAARLLGLKNVEAVHVRAEDLARSRPHSFDLVVSRAFSRIDLFVELGAPLMKRGGCLVAMKGPATGDELDAAGRVLEQNGLICTETTHYCLPFGSGDRSLIHISRNYS